ncbi:hypothetical protein [Leifsonia shinshuensis]|uniref:DUF5134 domain-containing protein n=1 Tax=Leifsonia shinshuensis TaxID=150026 RepID=A0A853CXB7_9MICO|nr:hypothetical protein [Leifsonia shinshuensis]NYJ24889.1 hypothetical protein [Leifsonia shinshuensis]
MGALGASTVSACCLLGSPRPVRVWVSAGLMVLAMAGCVLSAAVPGIGLLSILLSLASAGFALQRRAGRVAPMSLHRALGGVTMAALVAMSLGMSRGGASASAASSAHAHGVSLGAIAVAFVAGYVAYSVWLLVTMVRAGQRPGEDPGPAVAHRRGARGLLELGEVAGMAVGVLLMAVM